MNKKFGFAYLQSKKHIQDQNEKYGIIKKIRLNLGGLDGLELESKPKKDDDPVDLGGIFFNHIDRSEIGQSSLNENYPLGNMIEHYDIERENEICLNQNTCQHGSATDVLKATIY